ncbi:MAG: lactonase family protein [Leptospirales bacterium]|nr:lactonase family protein [Leptospirales bacterium]
MHSLRRMFPARSRLLAALVSLLCGAQCVEYECRPTDGACSPLAFLAVYAQRLPRYVYVAGITTPTEVVAYAVDAASGSLTSRKVVAATGDSYRAIAIHPSGGLLFLAIQGSGQIESYRIDRSTGALSLLSTIVADTGLEDIILSPDGRRLYALTISAGEVISFVVNEASGELQAVLPTEVVGIDSHRLAIDSSGALLVTADHGSNQVDSFPIDAASGRASSLATLEFSLAVRNTLRFHHSRPVLYMADSSGAYTGVVDTAAPTMALVGTASAGSQSSDVFPAHSGRFALVSDSMDGLVYQYAISAVDQSLQSNGNIAAGSGAAGAGPIRIAIDESDRLVYVANATDGTLLAYRVQTASGILQQSGVYAATPAAGVVAIAHF